MSGSLSADDVGDARAFLENLRNQLPVFPGRSPRLLAYTQQAIRGIDLLGRFVDASDSSTTDTARAP